MTIGLNIVERILVRQGRNSGTCREIVIAHSVAVAESIAFDIANRTSAIADYIVGFIKLCAIRNVYFTTQGVLLKTIKTNVVHMLYLETWGHAIRTVGAAADGAAAGVDTAEIAGGA